MRIKTVLSVLLLCLVAMTAQAKEVIFAWDAPTHRTDGELLEPGELKHHVVKIDNTEYIVLIEDGTTFSIDVGNGDHTVTVKAVDQWDISGAWFTPPLAFTVTPSAPPGVPMRLRLVEG